MYGCEIDGYLRDIGTPENYKKAQEEWKLINRK
jgi:NDP-sugar pyrophosphorylase family protein